jgi:hypothetical protein
MNGSIESPGIINKGQKNEKQVMLRAATNGRGRIKEGS